MDVYGSLSVSEIHSNLKDGVYYEPTEVSIDSNQIFALQRKFINTKATVSEIKCKWSTFFDFYCVFEHFKKLTDRDIQQINDAITQKYDLIYNMARFTKSIKEDIGDLEEKFDIFEKLIQIFKIFSSHYREKISSIYKV